MTWDDTTAIDAQNWANGCNYAHGGTGVGSTYGQNLYASAGTVPRYVITANLMNSALKNTLVCVIGLLNYPHVIIF